MEQRISLITLGVDDLERAANFYNSMGLKRYEGIKEGVAFYQLNGIVLGLYPREELAKDAGVEFAPPQTSAVALAYKTRNENEVDQVLELALKSGGKIAKPARKAFWGGRSGYFLDTEGHLWEVAYNSTFPIDSEGNISLPNEV